MCRLQTPSVLSSIEGICVPPGYHLEELAVHPFPHNKLTTHVTEPHPKKDEEGMWGPKSCCCIPYKYLRIEVVDCITTTRAIIIRGYLGSWLYMCSDEQHNLT